MIVLAGNANLRLERIRRRRVILLLAMFAEHAHEALGEHGFRATTRRDTVSTPHVHEAGKRAGARRSYGGVGENQVTSERSLHRDLRRFLGREFQPMSTTSGS